MKAVANSGDDLRVTITSEDATHVLGVLENVLIALTRKPPTVESVRGFSDHAERLSAKYPDGIAVLIVPRAPEPALERGVPRAALRTWRKLHPRLLCGAVLIRSTGVVGALQRGLLSMLMSMGPNTATVKLSSNPYDAAAWIARHNPRLSGDALALGRAVSAFVQENEQSGRPTP